MDPGSCYLTLSILVYEGASDDVQVLAKRSTDEVRMDFKGNEEQKQQSSADLIMSLLQSNRQKRIAGFRRS